MTFRLNLHNFDARILIPRFYLFQRRAIWYLFMSELEREEVQRRGVVGVGYSVGNFYSNSSADYEMIRLFVNCVYSIPIRPVAIFMCYSNHLFKTIIDVVVHLFSPFTRARFRPIEGKLRF